MNPYKYRYAENGGYDCMTGAFYITVNGEHVVDVDLRNFGQENCEEPSAETVAKAEAIAKLIVAALNKDTQPEAAAIRLLEPFAEFARKWNSNPIRGLAQNPLYSIHAGRERGAPEPAGLPGGA